MSNVRIGDLCYVFDGPHATPTKTEEGPIYLGIDAITEDGRLNPAEYNHLSEEDYKKWTKRVTPQKDDIVFSYEATLGRYAMIPDGFYGCLGRRLAIVRIKDNRVNPKWLYYYFLSPEWKVFVANHTVRGSTVDRISVEDFPEYPVPLPKREEQDAIVEVLSQIDMRIDTNTRICDELESMAKTIYDYWFTQFDFPGADGKPYRSSGGAMEWNEKLKHEIPKGWEIVPVIEGYDVCYGFPFDTAKFVNDRSAHPVVRIRDILERSISAYTTETVGEKYWLQSGDMVIGMDGNFHISFWDNTQALLNQRCVRIRSKGELPVFIAYFASLPYIKARERTVSRTTVGHLSADDIKTLYVLRPDKATLDSARNIFNSTLERICNANDEIRELTKLRDWLLPMLMNGQATVADATVEVSKVIPFAPQTVEVRQAARNFGDKKTDDTADLVKAFMRRKQHDPQA